MYKYLIFFLFVFSVSLSGFTQYRNTEGNFSPPDSALTVFAQETSELISLDGKLHELSWSKIRVVQDFFRMETMRSMLSLSVMHPEKYSMRRCIQIETDKKFQVVTERKVVEEVTIKKP